ncbi:MAG TPA: hypothetical protein VHY09_08330 [Candidatus Methylacidiphilales bacterium]|jgi:hypothetical protein|nr:hypothetical protein [Candidatus Methylacidiphilales bacterium]
MRIFLRLALAALLLAMLFPVRADTPAPTRISEPGVFSYLLPTGWVSMEVPHMYPIAVEKSGAAQKERAKAMISVTTKMAGGDLVNWCAQSMEQNKAQFAALGAQVGQLEPFLTASGAIGYRAPIDVTVRGRALHYVMYFFDGGDGTKITVTCACPAADIAHYAPLFESAMKTFAPK